jgi:NTP pyrophosphatase (non-canonical NTP hydrolase)
MQQLEQEIKAWADSRWPTRTLASRLRKLGEEVGELAEAVCNYESLPEYCRETDFESGRITASREAADCAIILSDICSLLGYSLSAVMREKFAEVQHAPTNSEWRGGVAGWYDSRCTCLHEQSRCPLHGGSR